MLKGAYGSDCLMDDYEYKSLIKHLIKSIMRGRDQHKQLFYGTVKAHLCVFPGSN